MEKKRYSRSALFTIRDAKLALSKPDFANNPRLAKLGLWRVDNTSSVSGTSSTPTPYAVDHLMPAFAKKKTDSTCIPQSKEDKPVRRIGSGRLVPRENWVPPQSLGKKINNRNGASFDEPEWFSGGPTSQHDTIELRGFEEDKEQPPQRPIEKDTEKEKHFDFGDFMEDVDVSVSKILGNDRKEENSRGKIWFGGKETFPTSRLSQQTLPQQTSQHQSSSTAPIPSTNPSFINFLRKEPEITSVEELEAKMRLAEVHERQKKQPDSDAFKKLLEQLGPGNIPQPSQMLHQHHQMLFGGNPPQVPGDFFINRQDILKTPEAQVLVQSFLKGELNQQDLFHIQKLNPNKHDIVGAVIQYTATLFPPFIHPIHRQPQMHYGGPMPSALVPPLNNRRQKVDSGSCSPTPNLAFTPTSVLRKMTGDIKNDVEIPPPPARMILGCHSQRPMGRPILKQGVHEDFHQINRRFQGKMKLLNYQRDGGLSPTSNQLARWFSPELLAQASAGKLPSLNIGQALSLQDFERSMQSSTNSTICNN
ncbi:Eif4enif1 family protein [Megaselia abdita]